MQCWNNNKEYPMPVVCSSCNEQVLVMFSCVDDSMVGTCPNCSEPINLNDKKPVNIKCKIALETPTKSYKATYNASSLDEILFCIMDEATYLTEKDFITLDNIVKRILVSYNLEGLDSIISYIDKLKKLEGEANNDGS